MKGLKHAALSCSNLERALNFYRDILGFKDYHCESKDWAMLYFRETTLSLVPSPGHLAIPRESLGSHPAHLGFVAHSKEEVDLLWQRLKSRDDVVVSKVEAHRDESYGFYFSDTEGNQLEFIYIPVTPIFGRKKSRRAVVLWAHGSSNPNWANALEELKNRLNREKPELHWTLAFLERQTPSLNDLVEKLSSVEKIEQLFLIPMFLGEGRHVREDLPIVLKDLKEKFPDIDVLALKALGAQAPVVDALSDSLQLYIEEYE